MNMLDAVGASPWNFIQVDSLTLVDIVVLYQANAHHARANI
jgi:hypothetical protein